MKKKLMIFKTFIINIIYIYILFSVLKIYNNVKSNMKIFNIHAKLYIKKQIFQQQKSLIHQIVLTLLFQEYHFQSS